MKKIWLSFNIFFERRKLKKVKLRTEFFNVSQKFRIKNKKQNKLHALMWANKAKQVAFSDLERNFSTFSAYKKGKENEMENKKDY